MKPIRRAVGLSALLISASSCSMLKASPADDSGFLPNPELLHDMRDRAPFNAGWVPDRAKLDHLKTVYHVIVLEPIITLFAEEKIKARNYPTWKEEDRIEDAKELARYFEERIKASFTSRKDHPFTVVTVPTPNAFVWEIALTEVAPTSPAISVAATTLGAFLPGGSLLGLAGVGSVAFEGVIRDSNTGEVLATFKDREKDKTSPFSIRDFEMYGHIRVAMDDWARQFAELTTTPGTIKVEDSSPITLDPL